MNTRAVVPVFALAAVLSLPEAAAAAPKTGQSPDCKRFCMSVEPRQGPEGSVFRFAGRGWRPNRRVWVNFGAYCRPGEACIAILNTALLRTGSRGRFSFRLRAGQPGERRTLSRRPRYQVILPV